MAENQDLLNAVLADPDADEPRLAYADWCDTQHDDATQTRGTFIRTQIDLANLSSEMNSGQEYPLRYRSERLEDRYRTEWGRPLARLVDGFAFDRGFVELVTLPAQAFIQRAAELLALAPIRHLTLTDILSATSDVLASPTLKSIRSLALDRCNLNDDIITLLAASPHLTELRWLSIAENRVGQAGASALATAPYLHHLAYVNFFGNPIEPNEQYSYDSGYVMDTWLPDEGVRLEEQHGYLRWLHHEATTIADSIPNRFRITP